MGPSAPETVIAIYRVQAAREEAFFGLLREQGARNDQEECEERSEHLVLPVDARRQLGQRYAVLPVGYARRPHALLPRLLYRLPPRQV